ncbi:MAG: vWA domain-containing protein [Acidobacteriota bacterium]
MADAVADKKEQLLKKIAEKEEQLKQGRFYTDSSLDVVFMIDTTGSMDPYIGEVKDNIIRIVEKVLDYSPRIRMGCVAYKDHGGEGEDEFYLTRVLPLTFDRHEITEFMRSPKLCIGEGGGGPEAVECALHDAAALAWGKTAPKAIILIGDKPPHGVMDSFKACTRMRDYRDEVKAFKAAGTKIYPILCNSIAETEGTFRWMAAETGGMFFYLKELSDLSDLLTGICLKETGQFPVFQRALLESGDAVPQSKRLLLSQLSEGAIAKPE